MAPLIKQMEPAPVKTMISSSSKRQSEGKLSLFARTEVCTAKKTGEQEAFYCQSPGQAMVDEVVLMDDRIAQLFPVFSLQFKR
jgi:hypothetical protein